MKDELINRVYQNTILDILGGIDKEYHEELKTSYYTILKAAYSDVEIVDGMLEDAIKGETEVNKLFYTGMPPSLRLSYLIYDDAYQVIKNELLKSNELVVKKENKEIIDEKINIEEIESFLVNKLENVRDFNKLSAIKCKDDAIINYKYALGMSVGHSTSIHL